MSAIPVVRSGIRFRPDVRRVVIRPFGPGAPVPSEADARVERVLTRILALTEAEVASTLAATRDQFAHRHRDWGDALARNYAAVAALSDIPEDISSERQLLIGAYFSHEYSVEAAALTNPSMVPAPDQTGLRSGELRFITSVRAIGEGHLSSIGFRTGTIDPHGHIDTEEPSRYATTGQRRDPLYDRDAFRTKLREVGVSGDIADLALRLLPPQFTRHQLEAAINELSERGVDRSVAYETARIIRWIAASNYSVTFSDRSPISERVLFPAGPSESQGMEDARFVRFSHDDGSVSYYATYTAFDGFQVLPQLIETADFQSFRIATLVGEAARNKGMALFPRRIDGHYAALSRQDNENNYITFSDDIRRWHEPRRIQEPERTWGLMKLGNCGSPLETGAGWLVVTHGVGPMRRYVLGAILLDIGDPSRVIGRLTEPLLVPTEDERDGYVPNVVYSCGSLIHGDQLVIPYGFSDQGWGIATIQLGEVLDRLR